MTKGKIIPKTAKITVKNFTPIILGMVAIVTLGLISGSNHPVYVLGGLIYGLIATGILWFWPERTEETYSSTLPQAPKTHVQIYDSAAQLANSFNEPIITVNAKRKILFANDAALKLFPNLIVGKSVNKVVRHPNIKDIIRAIVDGDTPEPLNYVIHTPVEQHFRINVSEFGQAPNSDGEYSLRIMFVLYEITDIERANTLRADFLANASHELKTPVASLLGYIETLRGHAKNDPEARDRFLGIMQQQAERMQRLITDLLSLRKIEQTEHIAPAEIGDLYLAARTATEAVAPIAEYRKVKTKYNGPKSMAVIGVQDELVQLVLNIVDNAVQMSPQNSTVLLKGSILENWQPGDGFSEDQLHETSARRRIINPPTAGESYAVLRIADNGPGFKREHLPRLTERFYRITGDRSSRDKGTGLGLAIVKHIMLRHRGGLFIESAEGVGTEFTIMLPLHTQEDFDPDETD